MLTIRASFVARATVPTQIPVQTYNQYVYKAICKVYMKRIVITIGSKHINCGLLFFVFVPTILEFHTY